MFREVILPLSLPGIMIGFIFIFVLVMGDFATVRVIGGSTVDSVGNEVNVYYNNVDLPTAAAGASVLVIAMMVGVIILLKFAKIRDSVSVVAPAKERNRTLDAIGKWLLVAVLVVLGLYTLYSSWLTLLELAVGIAVVGAVMAGLYVVLGRKLQRVLGVFFCGFLVLMYGPTMLMTLLSFQGSRGLTAFPTSGIFSTYWYDILINDSTQQALRDAIVVSLKLSALVCIITAVLSLMLGMAFRERFRGSTAIFYLVLLSLMTPGLLLSLGTTLLTSYLGRDVSIYTTALGVQVVWALPFGFLVMLTVFNRYDARAEEAARDLGASAIRTFREVTLPIVWVGVFGAALFGFTLAWNEFERTYLVTGPVATLADGALHRHDRDRVPAVHLLPRRAHDAVLVHPDRALPGRQRHRRAPRPVEGDRGGRRREHAHVDGAGAQRRRLTPSGASAPSTSRSFKTSAYLWPMSKSAERCGVRARSETASTGTTMRYPSDMPSTTVARTQPDVVVPQTTTVSTPSAPRRACRSVPKNAEGCCFSNTTSPAAGSDERIDVAAFRAAQAGHEPGALDAERARVREIRLVGAVGVRHGRAQGARGGADASRRTAARPPGNHPRAVRA